MTELRASSSWVLKRAGWLGAASARVEGVVEVESAVMKEDREFLVAWRRGDEDAGVELFERHYERVSRFFRNKAEEHAPDLVQRTFLVCLETRGRMREGTSFRCYLFGVARNVLFEHYRKSRRENERLDFAERSVEDIAPTPTSLLAREQESQILLQALRQIPLESQLILELYYWEGMRARARADEPRPVPAGAAEHGLEPRRLGASLA
jgi:RNA polymerase sigma-70 factor (ECF subfamily)